MSLFNPCFGVFLVKIRDFCAGIASLFQGQKLDKNIKSQKSRAGVIINIMLSRELGGIQESFLSYGKALASAKYDVLNITSASAKINAYLEDYIALPSLFTWCPISILYLKYLIIKYKPNIIIAHGRRGVSFSYLAKRHQLLIGVAHNYKIQHLIDKCDHIITITDHLKEYIIKAGVSRDVITTIPNMISVNLDYIAPKYNLSKAVVIGAMGRFVQKKGFADFLHAIKILHDKKLNIQVIIGGSGAEENRLKNLSQRLGLSDIVKFIGWVQDKDDFFSNIDIFCLPSKHEPFGIIILEAMHHSRPIISSNSEGPNEILEDKKDALIFDKNSVEEMAWCLEKAILNPLEASRYSKSAYQKLINKYDVKKIAYKLDLLIRSFARER